MSDQRWTSSTACSCMRARLVGQATRPVYLYALFSFGTCDPAHLRRVILVTTLRDPDRVLRVRRAEGARRAVRRGDRRLLREARQPGKLGLRHKRSDLSFKGQVFQKAQSPELLYENVDFVYEPVRQGMQELSLALDDSAGARPEKGSRMNSARGDRYD